MKVFLGGEGPDDLGRWAKERVYAEASNEMGVLEALLRRIAGHPVDVIGGHPWKRIPKYRLGRDVRAAEIQNVMGLANLAYEQGADALVFARDRDRDEAREQDVRQGLERARAAFPELSLAGGLAVEALEAWILALLGDRRAESHGKPKVVLGELHGVITREQKVSAVEDANLDAVPRAATSLAGWISSVRAALATDDDA